MKEDKNFLRLNAQCMGLTDSQWRLQYVSPRVVLGVYSLAMLQFAARPLE